MNCSFTLLLDGGNINEHLDQLFENGCDDATFGERDGVSLAIFDREAATFAEALGSAIQAVESTVPGLRVVRVEPEELVTASEIAARTARTRESIRQLFEGTRGSGDFPKPAAWLSDRTRLWHWGEVARWFSRTPTHEIDDTEEWTAEVISGVNALLTLRRFFDRLQSKTPPAEVTSTGATEQYSSLPIRGISWSAMPEEFSEIFSWLSTTERRTQASSAPPTTSS